MQDSSLQLLLQHKHKKVTYLIQETFELDKMQQYS